MKAKQRFVLLGALVVVLFTTKDKWIPHLPIITTNRRSKPHKPSSNDHESPPPYRHHADRASSDASQELFQATDKPQEQHHSQNINIKDPTLTLSQIDAWQLAQKWLQPREIYPGGQIWSGHDERYFSTYIPEISQILHYMAHAKVVSADVFPRGTQLKLLLTFEGGQKAVFKPRRYDRDYIIDGESWDGFDRHNSEVAAFHLDHVLNIRKAPFVVGRKLHMRDEVLPVASDQLKITIRTRKNETDDVGKPKLCFFGKCYYCKEKDLACPHGVNSGRVEGSVTLFMGKPGFGFEKLRHPYQRTYKKNRLATWQQNDDYCTRHVKTKVPYNHGPRLLDITEGAVFDYLLMNGDRHHYEIFKEFGDESMMIMMDNAKGFGNPQLFDKSILAPIRQCCILRRALYTTLLKYRNILGRLLQDSMETDPINPVVTNRHLDAVDKRVEDVIQVVENCIKKVGEDAVLMETWEGLPHVKDKTDRFH